MRAETVGIVLDSRDFARHAELIALEIDYTILDFCRVRRGGA